MSGAVAALRMSVHTATAGGGSSGMMPPTQDEVEGCVWAASVGAIGPGSGEIGLMFHAKICGTPERASTQKAPDGSVRLDCVPGWTTLANGESAKNEADWDGIGTRMYDE